jgi:antitoxin CptB|tara:strand:+ start:67 stop:306 length:240 start_codon:yes stop_codon:yes gene_type:complete
MNTQINKTKWKCRRGLRELDLLFRNFSSKHLETLCEEDFEMFNIILDREDQQLYDFIFKNTSLGNKAQEDFILQHIKKF